MGFWPRRIVCTSGVRPLSSSGYQLNSGGSGRPTLPQSFLDVVTLNLLAQQSDECHKSRDTGVTGVGTPAHMGLGLWT